MIGYLPTSDYSEISLFTDTAMVGTPDRVKEIVHKTFRSVANTAVKLPMRKRVHRLQQELQEALDYQQQFLLKTLDQSASSEYGQKYNFLHIDSVEQFQQQVPLADYTTLKPYIDRMLQKEQNVLTSLPIKRFAKSAGTTGSSSKYIPVTKQALDDNHLKAAQDSLGTYLKNNPDSDLLKGYGMVLPGNFVKNPHTDEENVGFISAILSEEKPRYGKYFTAIDQSQQQVDDRRKRMDLLVDEFADRPISSISGVGPWIVKIGKKVEKNTGKPIEEVWPELELVLSGGVPIEFYRKQYEELFGKEVNIYNIYNASEGFFGFQNENNDHSLLLATSHGIFYEFIPMNEFAGRDSQTVVPLDQVETGTDYAIVITNNAGFWRYIVGDTVRFVDRDPYKIEVTGRTQFTLSVFDEQVVQDHIVQTLQEVCDSCDCCIREYTVGPHRHPQGEGGCHERIIERERPPNDKNQFVDLLDKKLQENSHYYHDKRENDVLMTRPIVHDAPQELFYKRLESKGKLGGQHKVPNLSNDRGYLEELLEMMHKT